MPVLLCAFAGYAMMDVVSVAFNASSIEAIIREQAILCAFRPPFGWLLVIRGSIGLLVLTFTQGLVTSIALQGSNDSRYDSIKTRLRVSCRATVARFPALLSGALVYGACMAVVLAGLSVPLSALQLDPAQLRTSIGLDLLVDWTGREAMPQAVNALLPDPGTLACGVAGSIRDGVDRLPERFDRAAATLWQPVYPSRPRVNRVDASVFWPVTIGSVALMILIETLLRFRVMAALTVEDCPARSQLTGRLGPTVAASVRLGWQNFGVVTRQLWLLRITIACVQVPFVAIPVMLAERVVIPRMAYMVGQPWMYPVSILLIAVSAVLVNSVLTAFTVVYDTRLFAALQRNTSVSVTFPVSSACIATPRPDAPS